MEKSNKINPAITALIIIVLIGISTVGVALLNKDSGDTDATVSSTASDSKTATSTNSSSYQDGKYSSQGTYITPGGRESIELTVTLKGGVIEDADLEQQASGGDTVIYQRKFASGYKAEVVGKNIDEVELSRVAGSSLTSNGFNNALEQIKTDAAS